ncbi:MAG TPA: porin, partial [Cyanobacteria bacterium UBA9273]|nr:porin [Cyanobacteria bacterium UBA9273]
DLETLQRLVQEFQAELTALGARVDNLEGRVAFLEDHQFSTTTKLNGLVFMNLTGAFADDDVRVETINLDPPFGDLALRQAGRTATGRPAVRVKTDDPEITFSNLAWLTLNTSFTGRDSLVTQLAAGNGESPANDFASAGLFNSFGTPFTDQTAGINNGVNDVIIRELFYSFPVGDKLQVVVGPRVNWYRYFDANAFTFFLTGAGSFNSIGSTLTNTIDRGSGAIAVWNFNQKFKLAVGYLGENTEFLPGEFGFNTASNPSKGLFSPTNTASAELTFSPTDKINVRLIYNYSNIDPNVPIFDENGNITGFGVGGATGEPIYGVADDGFGGSISNAIAHSFGINFDWLITRGIGVFGRYTYGITNIDPKTPGRDDGQIEAQSLQLGVAFRDLGKEGALFSLSYLIPFSVLDGRNFLVAGGGDGGVQYEFEAAYFYPVTNNIALVPSFYLIGNPNNFSDNPNIYVGNLRAQFSF